MSDPVTFEVVAADEAAEIYLIDGDFRLVDKGIGRKTNQHVAECGGDYDCAGSRAR